MKNIAVMARMASPVKSANECFRRPAASNRWPLTGATAATTNPANPIVRLSQVAELTLPPMSLPTFSVRYTE